MQSRILRALGFTFAIAITVANIETTSVSRAQSSEKPEAAPDIYSSILADINGRYVLGYYPANKLHDGRRRSVSVKVRGHDEYVISGRRSYYAPEPEP